MNQVEKRFITTTLLLIPFIIVSTTGIILYLDHSIKHQVPLLTDLHIYSGLVMILIAIYHFWLNWKMYANEAKVFFR